MSTFSAVPPTLTFVMLGALGAGALYNLWIWLHRRHDTLHLWTAGWCAIGGSYLVSHYIQQWSEVPERVVLSARLAWVSGLLIILVLVGLTQTLVRGRCSRRSIVCLGGLNAALILVTMLTDLIATSRIYQRTDRIGGQYWAPVPGPWMVLLVPYIFAVFVYCFAIVGRAKQLDRGERWVFLVGFSIYVAGGLNDALHAARYIQSIRVFDYAFAAVGFGLTYLMVRRYTRLSESLEIEIAAQTQDLRTRQEQLGALVRAGQVVMAGLDLHETLTRLIGEASRISGAPHVAVLLRDEGARTLRLTAHMGDTLPPGHELELGQSISGLVAERGEPIYVANVVDDPRNSIPDRDRAAGIVAYLGLPIKAASIVLGVLVLKTTAPRAFDREELAILASFAQQAAIAIENARLYAALEDRVKRLDLLTGLNRLISDSLDVDRILKQIADAAAALMGAGLVIVWTADEDRQMIQARASSDDTALSAHPHPTKRFGQGVMGWVVQNRRPLSVPDLALDPRVESSQWFVANNFRSGVALPILRGGDLLGGLSLLFRDSLPPNLEDDRLLRAFIDQAGIAIEHARLYAAESAARQAAERALDEVTHLQGMLPICSYCKKIRNEQNSWEQLERYISEHSHATFSHGICPECRNTVVARQLEQWQGA